MKECNIGEKTAHDLTEENVAKNNAYGLTKKDLITFREDIRRGISRALQRKKLDLIKFGGSSENSGIILLGIPLEGHSCFFLCGIPTKVYTPSSYFPWEIPLEPGKSALEEVTSRLPGFIEKNYPGVSHLPINIYRCRNDYRTHKPPLITIPSDKVS